MAGADDALLPPFEAVLTARDLTVHYGSVQAVHPLDLDIEHHCITSFIGPSGCGKSTVLRCFNRMNDLIPGARVEGTVRYHGVDLYGPTIDAVAVRRRIGMVFQRPNPFPKSIYDNVAFGPRLIARRPPALDDVVERALRAAVLWDEVKDRLDDSALGLSGGQQQRLCIARAVAVEPDILLMDEPCSALDPIATGLIEELMIEMTADLTIVIVTHNLGQAARVSDRTAFFSVDVDEAGGARRGRLVEVGETKEVFANPVDGRTEAYVTGRFG
ncbi:MAG: phosphate ABC transporter ATP-binding protein PstB [Acidimicrobiales bacterium]